MALLLTGLVLVVFNWEPHEEYILNAKIFKNFILGIILFVCFYSIAIIEEVVERYQITLQDRNRTIRELKQLLFERNENDG